MQRRQCQGESSARQLAQLQTLQQLVGDEHNLVHHLASSLSAALRTLPTCAPMLPVVLRTLGHIAHFAKASPELARVEELVLAYSVRDDIAQVLVACLVDGAPGGVQAENLQDFVCNGGTISMTRVLEQHAPLWLAAMYAFAGLGQLHAVTAASRCAP